LRLVPRDMQKREGRAKHRSKRAWLPWGEDAPFETCGPQPKVGTLEPVAASETYSRDMQKEEGSSRRCSNLAWLPYVGDDDARPKAWIPQPKVGWLEPDKAFVAEADEVRESNFTRPKTQRVHWRLPHVDDDDSWPRAWIPQPKVEMSEPDRTSVAEIDEVRESRFTQSKTVEDWGSAATADPRKVKQDCDTDSSVSDIGEDVQVLIGGHDESTAWHYEEHTGWSRLAGGLECSVRLSDVRALPHGNAGELLSFGSLGHLVHSERCKVCVFHRRKSCRHSWLCTFCHAHPPHMRARPPQKRRKHQSDNVMAIKSDTQNVMCKGILGTRSGPWLVTLCWRDAALLLVVAVVLLAHFNQSDWCFAPAGTC